MVSIDVEIDQLRWFVMVAEGRTVTAAAAELHVSQPALSRGLARLEHEIGVPLFDRVGRVLRLNSNGRTLLDATKRALNSLDGAVRTIGTAADPTHGTVRFAFLNTLGAELVPVLLSGFRARYPAVEFLLRQGGTSRNEQSLLDGEVDMVMAAQPFDQPGITWQPILEEPLALVVPAGHRLATRRKVKLAEVSHEPFVTFSHGFGLRPITERLCQQAGFTPQVAFEGEDPAMLRGLVGAGCGVALLAPAPGPLPDIVELPISAPRCARTIGVGWCPDHYAPAVVEAFRSYVLTESSPPATWAKFWT
ncbi:DNA-binding transcriptional LysR family regulator [Kibdelosporangium banguiense]|uniref:DNA-binding transcriptional LysR family regulator n=1 Tax=Kibdelosporangium banguiense TaxID=1365924 RepID=A0ABS4U272_9PSEU|nr:LysR family transcriptional regulator [Kibdelosporangium banguiense]MBP2330735.1 DNA-binding transcriptional LysR family regulator [Kibdelosporangium banguiense]